MHLFVSDYEFDAGDLSLMPIIIPQFDLQAEFPDLDFEDSGGENSGNRSGRRRRPSCSD